LISFGYLQKLFIDSLSAFGICWVRFANEKYFMQKTVTSRSHVHVNEIRARVTPIIVQFSKEKQQAEVNTRRGQFKICL
jgi:hypothetical protein